MLIDWTTVLSSTGVATILGAAGLIFKFLGDRETVKSAKQTTEMVARGEFLAAVLKEVESRRDYAKDFEVRLGRMQERVDDCEKSKEELRKLIAQIRQENDDFRQRIEELEAKRGAS